MKKQVYNDFRRKEELRIRPFYTQAFANHCKHLGLQCSFAHNIVYVVSPISGRWKITHDNCWARFIEHLENKGVPEGETYEPFHSVSDVDIFRVAVYIAYYGRPRHKKHYNNQHPRNNPHPRGHSRKENYGYGHHKAHDDRHPLEQKYNDIKTVHHPKPGDAQKNRKHHHNNRQPNHASDKHIPKRAPAAAKTTEGK